MKKHILSTTLALAVLAGSLFACQAPVEEKDPGITLASADAQSYADWLTERLTTVNESVVIGIGNSDEYDADMTDFEDDGYVIKRMNNDLVIIGKTAEGLDRGVRKYANAIDKGETLEEVTYHKGVRIEELKLFGTPISEFVINHPEDSNANMEFAATELQMLVKKATGVELPIVVGASDAAKKIELRHTDDEALADDGYRYFEENGNLVIEGAVERGCLNGVYRFLQNECGWEGLIFGDSYLNEADLIDVAAGLNESEVPIFEYLSTYHNFGEPYPELTAYVNDRTAVAWNSEYMSYGANGMACHGMGNYKWHPLAIGTTGRQVCHSSESVYKTVLGNILAYIEDHEEAGGKAGVTLKDIDIAQVDNNRYCYCTDCTQVSRFEDKSVAGPVLKFANRLAEELNEKYDNISVHIFAYMGAKKPPEKTKAHEMVYVTYCRSGCCINHSMYGDECEPIDISKGSVYNNKYEYVSNNLENEFIKGWCEVTDNINIWYYDMDTVFHQYTMIDVLLDDFRYMEEHGIRGLFFHNDYHGFGFKGVEQQLVNEMNWHKGMTEEEYEEALCEILRREYGDGWEYIREYIDYLIEAYDRADCYFCSSYGNNKDPAYDWTYMKDNYMKMVELIDKAARVADSEKQELKCELLYTSTYYSGVFSQYFPAYEAEDEATLAKLNEQYDYVYDLVVEFGYDPEAFADAKCCKMYPTLEEEAWNVWIGEREIQVGSEDLRPAPDWYIEQQATATEA